MRWSEQFVSPSLMGAATYALAISLAVVEAGILAAALLPNVDSDYRAFYIDGTTTCLNRGVSADYSIGEIVSFRRDGAKRAKDFKVCGWSGPAGDGTHSLGESSRLRVRLTNARSPIRATLEIAPVLRPPQDRQRVFFSINGIPTHATTLIGPDIRSVSLDVPDSALVKGPTLELDLSYPDAIPPTRSASAIYKRAIKLTSFRLDFASLGQQIPTGSIPPN